MERSHVCVCRRTLGSLLIHTYGASTAGQFLYDLLGSLAVVDWKVGVRVTTHRPKHKMSWYHAQLQ